MFTANAEENELRILQIVTNTLQEVGTIDLSPYGGGSNSFAAPSRLLKFAELSHIQGKIKRKNFAKKPSDELMYF